MLWKEWIKYSKTVHDAAPKIEEYWVVSLCWTRGDAAWYLLRVLDPSTTKDNRYMCWTNLKYIFKFQEPSHTFFSTDLFLRPTLQT